MKENTQLKLWFASIQITDDKRVLAHKSPIKSQNHAAVICQLGKAPRFNTTEGSIYNVYDREPNEADLLSLAKFALDIYREGVRQSQARVNRLAKWCEKAESKSKQKARFQSDSLQA